MALSAKVKSTYSGTEPPVLYQEESFSVSEFLSGYVSTQITNLIGLRLRAGHDVRKGGACRTVALSDTLPRVTSEQEKLP